MRPARTERQKAADRRTAERHSKRTKCCVGHSIALPKHEKNRREYPGGPDGRWTFRRCRKCLRACNASYRARQAERREEKKAA
jgi:hypothetical protein